MFISGCENIANIKNQRVRDFFCVSLIVSLATNFEAILKKQYTKNSCISFFEKLFFTLL